MLEPPLPGATQFMIMFDPLSKVVGAAGVFGV